MTKRDEFFRERLLRDYDRLIQEIELTGATMGKTFCLFLTPMEGQLIAASLRTSREREQADQPKLTGYDPTAFGDQVADQVRRWYEKNRESWWDRHRFVFWRSSPDRSGEHADEFMLRLINQVGKAGRDLTVDIRAARAAADANQ